MQIQNHIISLHYNQLCKIYTVNGIQKPNFLHFFIKIVLFLDKFNHEYKFFIFRVFEPYKENFESFFFN